MINNRKKDIDKFYELLEKLSEKFGFRILSECSYNMWWPKKGIYFFFENNEYRKNGKQRIVRVGTHATIKKAKTTLWNRLKQHKGTKKGFGNHRSSVFRKLIGEAIINKENLNKEYPDWNTKPKNKLNKNKEKKLEKIVSEKIGNMPFLFLEITGNDSHLLRSYIEKNSIALLSNYEKNIIDENSDGWLGLYSNSDKVKKSGLWNNHYVKIKYESKFLKELEKLINNMIKKYPQHFV